MTDNIEDTQSLRSKHVGNELIVFDDRVFSKDIEQIFSPAYWQEKAAVTGHEKGRGTTWFFKTGEKDCVLRHYYRGGMIGKVFDDHYIYTGQQKTRAYKEFYLLKSLRELSLPVPQPLAFRIRRSGVAYSNDIIIERINNATSLVNILAKNHLDKVTWQRIGKTLREFHNHGVYHDDLNIHNILLDDTGCIWLIDFDKGEIRNDGAHWKPNNISRLHRSFLKEKSRHSVFHWDDKCWQLLIDAYSG